MVCLPGEARLSEDGSFSDAGSFFNSSWQGLLASGMGARVDFRSLPSIKLKH
jgi:hypothetical protein